jgi:hypothetical protein
VLAGVEPLRPLLDLAQARLAAGAAGDVGAGGGQWLATIAE